MKNEKKRLIHNSYHSLILNLCWLIMIIFRKAITWPKSYFNCVCICSQLHVSSQSAGVESHGAKFVPMEYAGLSPTFINPLFVEACAEKINKWIKPGILYHFMIVMLCKQCMKLNFWSTRLKRDVRCMFYTKFLLPRPNFYSPSSKCTCIDDQVSFSFPHCRNSHTAEKDQTILPGQYHGSWWPGDFSHQGIISHAIYLVCTEYLSAKCINEMLNLSIVTWPCWHFMGNKCQNYHITNSLQPSTNSLKQASL